MLIFGFALYLQHVHASCSYRDAVDFEEVKHQCKKPYTYLNNFKFYIMRLAKWFRWVFPAKNKTNESINIVNSIAKAKKLHKELILYAHPDRHPNNQELATRLSERINENRFNYSELLKLQDIINKELYIKE